MTSLAERAKKKRSQLIWGLGLLLLAIESFSVEFNTRSVDGVKAGFADTFKAAKNYDPRIRSHYWSHQAQKEEEEIRFSRMLPDVRLSAVYQSENSDNIYTDRDSGYYDPDRPRSSGYVADNFWRVNLRQPLIDYVIYEDYEQAKSVVEASKHTYERANQELIYRVADQYLKVLLATQQVYFNQQKLDALELKRRQAGRALDVGVGDQLSVLLADSKRDLANSELLQAKSELSDAQTLLTNLTGVNVDFPKHWVRNSENVTPSLLIGTENEWLQAVDNNLQVKAAQARITQQKHALSASKAQHYPTLNLNLGYVDRSSDDDFRDREDMVAALEFDMPLYSGGRTQAGVRQARARLKASEAELEYIVNERKQQIRLSYNRLISFKQRLMALTQSRESGKRYLDAAERALSLKLSDQVTVIDARTKLIDTQLQIASTWNEYLLADLTLRLEAGRLSEQRLFEYDRLFNSGVSAAR